MRWTNVHAVHEALSRAIVDSARARDEEERGDFTITELLMPPQMLRLLRERRDELTVDVSERLNSFLGYAVHLAIARSALPEGALIEERLYMDVGGYTVSGRLDHYTLVDGVLTDWKVTSVYSFLLGPRREWEEQLNLYRLLLVENGYDVQHLQVVAILRDWLPRRVGEEGYPEAPYQAMDIPMWSLLEAREFLEARLREHTQEAPRPCTEEERWRRPDRFEVWRGGRRLRRFDDEEAARAWMQAQRGDGLTLVRARGEAIRCLHYCPVRSICPQAREEEAKGGEEDAQ